MLVIEMTTLISILSIGIIIYIIYKSIIEFNFIYDDD
jgi:hypothetical protein